MPPTARKVAVRQHHAGAVDDRYHNGAVRKRAFVVVEPMAAKEPRYHPVKPQHLDQGGARREQRTARAALVAPVGIEHATAEHPVIAERLGLGQQGRDCPG